MIQTDGKPTIACPRTGRMIAFKEKKRATPAERVAYIEAARAARAAEKIAEEAAEAYDKSKADPYDEAHGRNR
jgi:hypothetical protein